MNYRRHTAAALGITAFSSLSPPGRGEKFMHAVILAAPEGESENGESAAGYEEGNLVKDKSRPAARACR